MECRRKKPNSQNTSTFTQETKNNSNREITPIIHEALHSHGHPLDPVTRTFMEPRIGHDLSQVRIHTDVKAAESAQRVNALAYTVGRDIIFQPEYYKPKSTEGKKLLAHELTHVLQQNQAIQRSGITTQTNLEIGKSADVYEHEADTVANNIMRISDPAHPVKTARISTNYGPILQRYPYDGRFSRRRRRSSLLFSEQSDLFEDSFKNRSSHLRRGSTLPYREATELLTCIRIMGEDSSAYCRQAVLGETPVATSPSPPPFVSCEPNRTLTWADFTGSPSGTHSAFTAYDFPTATTPGGTRIKAVFNPGRSFVLPQFGNPTNSTLNGCTANITNCESFFPPGSTGGSYALNSTPSTTCPASIRGNPSVTASSLSDCSSIIATECQRVAQAESDRLLRHEQLHFDIACTLVGKANNALTAGSTLATVQTALTAKDTQVTTQYDADTQHGCNAAQQTTWTNSVRAGLRAVTI